MKRVVIGMVLLLAGVVLLGACSSEKKEQKQENDFLAEVQKKSEAAAQKKQQQIEDLKADRQQKQQAYQKQMQEQAEKTRQMIQQSQNSSRARSASSGAQTQVILNDKDLTFVVLNKIRMITGGAPVSVSCKDGVVQLYGLVSSEAMKKKVVDELKKTPGVKKVDPRELGIEGQ